MSPYDPKLYPTEADIDRAYHPLPRDDAWKRVTLEYVQSDLGRRIVVACCGCQRRAMFWPRAYAEEHMLSMDLPLKQLERRIRCTSCNARIIHIMPETYSIEHDKLGTPRA